MKAADRPTVPDVMPYVQSVYRRHAAGCCLHVLTDDGNVGDSTADFISETAVASGHADCIRAASMLRQMTRTQRTKVYKARKSPTPEEQRWARLSVEEVDARYAEASASCPACGRLRADAWPGGLVCDRPFEHADGGIRP